MIINGTNTLDYGLVPLKVEGAYSMPPRLNPYMHDWGDEIEPILLESQMAWQAREIQVDFLYDESRATSANQSISKFIDVMTRYYQDATDIVLTLSEASGGVGSFNVKVKSISHPARYKGGYSKLSFLFYERVPSFNGTLPSLPGSAPSISLGGYGFSQFGIVISKLSGINSLGDANELGNTHYLSSNELSQYRALQTFNLSCYCVGVSENDVLQKIHSFQKLLISPNLLNFRYDGYNFDAFAALGFNATKRGKRVLQFDLILYRI